MACTMRPLTVSFPRLERLEMPFSRLALKLTIEIKLRRQSKLTSFMEELCHLEKESLQWGKNCARSASTLH